MVRVEMAERASEKTIGLLLTMGILTIDDDGRINTAEDGTYKINDNKEKNE